MQDVNWNAYPATLRAEHLAQLYQRPIGGIRKAAQRRSRKIPTPCETQPYGWRKSDVRRHFERRTA